MITSFIIGLSALVFVFLIRRKRTKSWKPQPKTMPIKWAPSVNYVVRPKIRSRLPRAEKSLTDQISTVPILKQPELFNATWVDDHSADGLPGQRKYPEAFRVRLFEKMDRDDALSECARRTLTFGGKLTNEPRESWLEQARAANKRARAVNGGHPHAPVKFMEPEDELAYHGGPVRTSGPLGEPTFWDRLAMGDAQAGEELRRMEEEGVWFHR